MDLIPDIQIPTQNKLIPDPILTPAKSGINTALELSSCDSEGFRSRRLIVERGG